LTQEVFIFSISGFKVVFYDLPTFITGLKTPSLFRGQNLFFAPGTQFVEQPGALFVRYGSLQHSENYF